MDAVPITFYLQRKNRKSDGASADPNGLDIQAATEAWYQKGFAEGMAHAKVECDAAILRQKEEGKLLIATARRAWSETESAFIARQIDRAIAALKAEIADAAARVFRPLAARKLTGDALAKLASEIQKLLSHDDAIHLRISGPADLVLELRKHIPAHAAVTVLAGDKPEVTVFANKTVIETRLGEWLACIGVNSHDQDEEG